MLWGLITEKNKPVFVHCTIILVVVLYAVVGAFVFSAVESSEPTPQPEQTEVAYDKIPLDEDGLKCLENVLQKTQDGIVSPDDAMEEIEICYRTPVSLPDWSFSASILFAFTLVTTIGYGNVAPVTSAGRVFCVIYGLIGIPLTMLAIGNVGKFLVEAAKFGGKKFRKVILPKLRDCARYLGMRENGAEEENGEEDTEFDSTTATIAVLMGFLVYVAVGAIVLPLYEDDMHFFTAIYFNFVTLTTVGLGDMVPKRKEFLLFTVTYVTVGLALTTIAIEMASEYLKKLHYFGRKMKNAGAVSIWFGGKKMLVSDLIRNLGEKYNIAPAELENLTFLDQVVEEAIQKEEDPDWRPPPGKSVLEEDFSAREEEGTLFSYLDDDESSIFTSQFSLSSRDSNIIKSTDYKTARNLKLLQVALSNADRAAIRNSELTHRDFEELRKIQSKAPNSNAFLENDILNFYF